MQLSRIKIRTLTGRQPEELPEFAGVPPADPIDLASRWIARAIETGVREPGAFALATADGEGRPASRFVQLKGLDERGLLFVGQTISRKGRDIATNPVASASFYWQELLQQLHFFGTVSPIDPAESDEIFAERPLPAKASASVSRQDAELDEEPAFFAEIQRLIAAGRRIDRPDRWTGYRLKPERIEFWQGNPERMHHRLEYRLEGESWLHRRLQP